MTDTDEEILKSLESFTQHYEAFISDQFSEMRACSFFDPVPDEELDRLVAFSRMATFKAGDRIISEGDVMRSFYVILFGSVTVYVKNRQVGKIGSGDCMGEGAFFAQKATSRLASVVADDEVILLEIPRSGIDQIDEGVQKYLNKALLLAMFKKLRLANDKINRLMGNYEHLYYSMPEELTSLCLSPDKLG